MNLDREIQQVLLILRSNPGNLREIIRNVKQGIPPDQVEYRGEKLNREKLISSNHINNNDEHTSMGRDIVDDERGWWVFYVQRKKGNEELEFNLKKSSLGINNFTKIGLALTSVFTLLSLIVTFYQWRQNQSILEVSRELLKIEKGRDSVSHLQLRKEVVDTVGPK